MSTALYQDALVSLANSRIGALRLQCPDASVRVDNPLCGDEVTLDLRVRSGTVEQIGHCVRGCILCEASAAWIASHAPGCGVSEIKAMAGAMRELMAHGTLPEGDQWAQAGVFSPVHQAKSRRRCVLLAFEALELALAELEQQ
ncbi:MAG: iron-sulfur cluster assembly scaffold protein [Gammaproteobacteria bacterium]|nr:iron-sulfur cluster assembly scaffold protein [Gammaproteobacteria bacterium]